MDVAHTVLLLPEDTENPYASDAKSILNILTIKSLYPDVYACVEMVDPKNVEHCRRAGADEIIVVGELSTNLLVQAALDHGITRMITELVSNRFGNSVYKIKPMAGHIGKSFFEVMCDLKKSSNILCLGVIAAAGRKLNTNPEADYTISEDDELMVIAESRPDLSAHAKEIPRP
ncbi:MAG: hypothetical protein GY868_21240 [Deltaproteobacteria bacterium]|nr:hypothetical protein [Deltaproteobacteria bacterium]